MSLLPPVDAVSDAIRHDFPGWSVFHQAGVWYATGPCSCGEVPHSRTLHARDVEGLRVQLDEAGR